MTTPHQGPGMWQQGDAFGALEWLASLDATQQENLRRAVNHKPVLTRLMETARRSSRAPIATGQRLSEGAQALASQTRQYGRDAIARAGEIRDNTVTRVTEFGQRPPVRADRATEVGNSATRPAGRSRQGRAAVEARQPRQHRCRGCAGCGPERRSVRPEHRRTVRRPGPQRRRRCGDRGPLRRPAGATR